MPCERRLLAILTQPVAWHPEALREVGIPPGPYLAKVGAPEERPRMSVHSRKRGDPTSQYVWGPDLRFLLEDQ